MTWLRAMVLSIAATAVVGAFATTAASADPGNGKSAEHASENSKVHETVGTASTTGDTSEPQPLSNADQNGTGANTTGPYDSTRDGSPSGNGNGDGNATGKPCAGCVGKADNKNPPGQLPGPQDHNNGYECDGNKGIAKTNPAHTGCENSPPQCNPQTENCSPGCDATVEDCNPCNAAVTDCTPGCDAAVEQCDQTTSTPPDSVLGEQITRTDPVVAGEALARTGFEMNDELQIAAVMLAAGAVLVLSGRRLQRRYI